MKHVQDQSSLEQSAMTLHSPSTRLHALQQQAAQSHGQLGLAAVASLPPLTLN
jgi:hypothetical protein